MAAGPDEVLCQVVNNDTVVCDGIKYTRGELLKDTNFMFWVYLCVYIALVLFAGKGINFVTVNIISRDTV